MASLATDSITTACRRVVQLLLTVQSVAVLVMVIGIIIGPERFWLIGLSIYVPFPVYLLPLTISLALSLLLNRVWRLLAACELVLVAWLFMGFQAHGPNQSSGNLRLMT